MPKRQNSPFHPRSPASICHRYGKKLDLPQVRIAAGFPSIKVYPYGNVLMLIWPEILLTFSVLGGSCIMVFDVVDTASARPFRIGGAQAPSFA
jgi:hypothetical protein